MTTKTPQLSGLAAKIRSTDGMTDAETFDLAGKDPSTVSNTILSAFAAPFEHHVRITLIIGAGKLERQKYHESLPKVVIAGLKEHGFEDGVDDPGTYKQQHDTGKNLKTIVVFPKLVGEKDVEKDVSGGNEGEVGEEDGLQLPGSGSPVYLVSAASEVVFERMLSSKIQSWSQKKVCMSTLEVISETVEQLQEKLFTGSPLSDYQQEFYDAVTLELLKAKQDIVKKSMAAQVDAGNLTRDEKSFLLDQVNGKIKTVSDEMDNAKKENKQKKVEKLNEMLKKFKTRETMLNKITPKPPQPLKTEPQIAKLRLEMAPIVKLESDAKGRLLSIKEQAKITRKNEIEEEIYELENAAREWFESDDVFNARVVVSRSAGKEAMKRESSKNAKKTSNSGSKTRSNASSWRATGTKSVGSAWSLPAGTSKKTTRKAPVVKKKASGGMFAAMMDSDSDSD